MTVAGSQPRVTLAFLGKLPHDAGTEPAGYGRAFARLRWRRAAAAQRVIDLVADAPAPTPPLPRFEADELWVAVFEPDAIPVAFEVSANPARGSALAAVCASVPAAGPAPHTLRELESGAALATSSGPAPARAPAPAIAFWPADLPPLPGETAGTWLGRVRSAARSGGQDAFAALVLADPSDLPRAELVARIPPGRRRLLDVGCGRGATGASLRAARPGLSVVGLEKDAAAAEAARERLDRVLVGDATRLVSELGDAGERFDAFLFGDVLEHVSEPLTLLAAARRAASPGAALVASVPNAGHVSLLRDLVLGRFDPVPAGLADAGHLRWFTRSSLEETLADAGWTVDSVEGLPGAPVPGAEAFRSALAFVDGASPAAWEVYQWIAVARAEDFGPQGAAELKN